MAAAAVALPHGRRSRGILLVSGRAGLIGRHLPIGCGAQGVEAGELFMAQRGDDPGGDMAYGVYHAGFVFGLAHAAWKDCCRVVLGEVAVGIVEHDFTVGGVFDDPGFQVVAHNSRDAAAELREHGGVHIIQESCFITRQGSTKAYRLNGRQATNKYTVDR